MNKRQRKKAKRKELLRLIEAKTTAAKEYFRSTFQDDKTVFTAYLWNGRMLDAKRDIPVFQHGDMNDGKIYLIDDNKIDIPKWNLK